ncbi:unnamed protein product [Lupinus luteus]|uniref:Uncharacterized protein n=1 Tax=Lupinus luteus TaxID=3873 RepID=A0AAV1XNQ3_LUPLU
MPGPRPDMSRVTYHGLLDSLKISHQASHIMRQDSVMLSHQASHKASLSSTIMMHQHKHAYASIGGLTDSCRGLPKLVIEAYHDCISSVRNVAGYAT